MYVCIHIYIYIYIYIYTHILGFLSVSGTTDSISSRQAVRRIRRRHLLTHITALKVIIYVRGLSKWACMCVYIYIYIYMYTHMYVYIYI